MKTLKKILVFCTVASAVLSVSASCYAAEWKETDKGMTYISDSGKAVKGMQEIDGKTYYFGKNGIMKKGWLTVKSGAKYYFNSDGSMRTGWLKIKSGKYYFSQKGVMQTGTVKIGKDYYFFGDDGVMLTGWQDEYYYCSNGKRAVNKTVTIDGEKVRFDKNGKVKTDSSSDLGRTDAVKTEEKIIPEEIVVTHTDFSISKGAKFKLDYDFKPIKTNCTDVTFYSSSPSVVSINSKGEVEALKLGSSYITIKSVENLNAFVKIKITVTE